MLTPVFKAKVGPTGVAVIDKEAFHLWAAQFMGQEVDLTLRKKRKARSTGKQDELGNQNGWYWGVIIPLCAKELGYTANEMHEIFLSQFAPFTYKMFNSKAIPIKIRSSEMNTEQFAEYCKTILIAMADIGIIIPEPDTTV